MRPDSVACLRIHTWHIAVLLAIPLFYAFLGRYCFPVYDDYPIALAIQGMSFQEAWSTLVAWSNGRFAVLAVYAFLTLHLDQLWLLALVPACIITTFLAPVYWIFRQLLPEAPRRNALFLALVAFLVVFTSFSSLESNLFYIGTVFDYQAPVNALLALVGCLLYLTASPGRRFSPVWLLALVVLPFAVSGNEMLTMLSVGALLVAGLTAVANGRPQRWGVTLLALAATVLGLASFFAPSNYDKGSVGATLDFFGPKFGEVVLPSLNDVVAIPLHYLLPPLAVFGLLLTAYFLGLRERIALLPRFGVRTHVLACLVALALSVFAHSLIIRLCTDDGPEDRYINVIMLDTFFFTFSAVIFAAGNIRRFLDRALFRKVPPVAMLYIFLGFLLIAKHNVRTVRDLANGSYAAHAERYMRTIDMVHQGRYDEVNGREQCPHAVCFQDSEKQFSEPQFIEYWSNHEPKTVF